MAAISNRLPFAKMADNAQVFGHRIENFVEDMGDNIRTIRKDIRKNFRKQALPMLVSFQKDIRKQAKPVMKKMRKTFQKQAAPAIREGLGTAALKALKLMDKAQIRQFRRRKRMAGAIKNWMAA